MSLANFFLHGHPEPPPTDTAVQKIRCPNEKCDRSLSELMMLNGKKVCPHCKTVIPDNLAKQLEKVKPPQKENDEENQPSKK